MDAIKYIQSKEQISTKIADFISGDNISVNYKIVEGGKTRIQTFKGDVIKIQGKDGTQTFTVRKISDGLGVERTFPLLSPNIESIVLNKKGKTRRAKLFYLRKRSGKSARIKEKRFKEEEEEIIKNKSSVSEPKLEKEEPINTSTSEPQIETQAIENQTIPTAEDQTIPTSSN